MKKVKIKLEEGEISFHKQSVFENGDELVVFSVEEFVKFYQELKECLDNALSIADDSLKQKSGNVPSTDALRIYNWIKKMEDNLETLDKTDIQKNLCSFK